MLRVLQVALVAIGSLLIVPFAVNVSTGGALPASLSPYADWLWPAAIACVVLVIAFEVWERLAGGRNRISAKSPNSPHNFDLALAQVSRYVRLRQRGSLAERVRVALALDDRPNAVRQPAHLVRRIGATEFRLSEGLSIVDIFDHMNQSMLLLGAPGSGKTTQLLDLAAALTRRAPMAGEPIPVVLDLAGWSRRRRRFFLVGEEPGPRPFVDWLLAGLDDRYGIPASVGLSWLSDDRLILLLDGLDEVRDADRERCVDEINAVGATRVAVCSRDADYDGLVGRLRLQGAVTIRPLTEEQVVAFFASVSPRLGGVAEALRTDTELWGLLTTPLMLNIMALAYGDRTAEPLAGDGDLAARRRQLFDAYVVEVIARRRAHERGDPERTIRALRALALTSANFGVVVAIVPALAKANRVITVPIYRFARTWVFLPWGAACTGVTVAGMGLSAGRSAALAVWTACSLLYLGMIVEDKVAAVSPFRRAALLLLGWLVGGIATAVGSAIGFQWLARHLADAPGYVRVGIAAALAVGIVALLGFDSTGKTTRARFRIPWSATLFGMLLIDFAGRDHPLVAYAGWAMGAAFAIAFGSVFAVASVLAEDGKDELEASRREHPWARRVFGAQAVTFAIATGALAWLGGSWSAPFWQPFLGWLAGVFSTFAVGFIIGGFIVRPYVAFTMVVAGELVPWRKRFLRFAVDRSILAVADGEYRFIHQLVRDHLAACDPEALAAQIGQRRVELTPGPG